MPDQLCSAPSCAHPATDFVCRSCVDELGRDLRLVEDLVTDLLVTIAREDRLGEPGPRGAEIPLPYRPDPADVARDLHAELAIWVRHLQSGAGQSWVPTRNAPLGELPPYRLPGRDTVEAAMWLERHRHTVSIDICGGQIVDCIGYAVRRAERATDRSSVQYLGPCECGPDDQGRPIELYARPGAARCVCRACEAVYDVAPRREWLLEQAADVLRTAPEMSRALPALLGTPLTVNMIHGYAHRGRLVPHGRTPLGQPLFRVGDVMEVLRQVALAAAAS